MLWIFFGVYIINRTSHGRLERRNFSSRVQKYFTRSLSSLARREISYLRAAMQYPLLVLKQTTNTNKRNTCPVTTRLP